MVIESSNFDDVDNLSYSSLNIYAKTSFYEYKLKVIEILEFYPTSHMFIVLHKTVFPGLKTIFTDNTE